ncbi:hypothetical protein ACOMHN_022229 [Nucella lapillus]
MPLLSINTNVPASEIPKDFLTKTSALIASELGKPENYVLVHVNPGQMMSFGASQDKCAMVYLDSLGKVGGERNKHLAHIIGNHIESCLGIPQDRFYIKICDIPRCDLGYKGSTFG